MNFLDFRPFSCPQSEDFHKTEFQTPPPKPTKMSFMNIIFFTRLLSLNLYFIAILQLIVQF